MFLFLKIWCVCERKIKRKMGASVLLLSFALLCFLVRLAIQIHFNPKSLSRRLLSCFPVDRWWSLSAACMVPLGATPRKRKFTLSTATPHCLPPDLHGEQHGSLGMLRRRRCLSLGALWRNITLPREEAPGTNRNGPACFGATRLGTEAHAGPRQHLSRTEGVSWRGRR